MALLLKEREPDLPVEYVFADTGVEHPSTYAFLDEVKKLLPLVTLTPRRSYEARLIAYGGFLPSKRNRWCTKELKIWSVTDYIGQDEATLYVGLRADEEGRLGVLTRNNERVRYPLREYGVDLAQVRRTTVHGLGLSLPSRRGCWLCWGQKRWEWVRLGEEYPDLFARAVEYERMSPCSDFTFIRELPLPDLWRRRGRILAKALKGKEMRSFPEWDGENDDGDTVCRVWCR